MRWLVEKISKSKLGDRIKKEREKIEEKASNKSPITVSVEPLEYRFIYGGYKRFLILTGPESKYRTGNEIIIAENKSKKQNHMLHNVGVTEFFKDHYTLTGREIKTTITEVVSGKLHGLKKNTCVIGFVPNEEFDEFKKLREEPDNNEE